MTDFKKEFNSKKLVIRWKKYKPNDPNDKRGIADIFFKLTKANVYATKIESHVLNNDTATTLIDIELSNTGRDGVLFRKGWNHLSYVFSFSDDDESMLRVIITGTGVGNGSGGTVKTHPRQ